MSGVIGGIGFDCFVERFHGGFVTMFFEGLEAIPGWADGLKEQQQCRGDPHNPIVCGRQLRRALEGRAAVLLLSRDFVGIERRCHVGNVGIEG